MLTPTRCSPIQARRLDGAAAGADRDDWQRELHKRYRTHLDRGKGERRSHSEEARGAPSWDPHWRDPRDQLLKRMRAARKEGISPGIGDVDYSTDSSQTARLSPPPGMGSTVTMNLAHRTRVPTADAGASLAGDGRLAEEKEILAEDARDELPPAGSRARVHCTGTIPASGIKFSQRRLIDPNDVTRDRPDFTESDAGAGQVILGNHSAKASAIDEDRQPCFRRETGGRRNADLCEDDHGEVYIHARQRIRHHRQREAPDP